MNAWEHKKTSFRVIDVRKTTGNFLDSLLKSASQTPLGEGICVVQTFEPKPLYSALKDLGFEYNTEKISPEEYRAYFYRVQVADESASSAPLKPTAILNFKKIDDQLANIAVDFWSLTWEKEHPAIDYKTKLLLSLSNAVGAGRFRQATRELVKGYAVGVKVEELDELFELFAWNQGMGHFASQIGPTPLFQAYQLIKESTRKELSKEEIMEKLMKQFGPSNPDVQV